MPITSQFQNPETSRGRKCYNPGQIVLMMVSLAVMSGMGLGVYFLSGRLRWIGLLLVAHAVLSLTVILVHRTRRHLDELRGLSFVQF